jgi:hypothetical protein
MTAANLGTMFATHIMCPRYGMLCNCINVSSVAYPGSGQKDPDPHESI